MNQQSTVNVQQVSLNPPIPALSAPPVWIDPSAGQSRLPIKETLLLRLVSLGLLIILILIFFGYLYISKNSITVYDQPLGDVVIIDRVVVANPGGAKIKLSINGVSPGGMMIGFSSWLPRGTFSFVGIPLGVSNIENRRGNEVIRPKANETVFVTLHDAGNLELGITSVNRLLRDVFGQPVVRKFTIQ
jgi:hypothetical protein